MQRILKEGTSTITEKKSRFLGYVIPADSVSEAAEAIAALKKKHYDARHVCYAYRIGSVIKSSDDGEPQGSAGRPIADLIEHEELDHCLIAVVRYFGGILLGVGGLIRAYTSAGQEAIRDAGLISIAWGFPLSVTMDYNDYGRVDFFLNENHLIPTATDYGANVRIRLMIPSESHDQIEKELNDMTSGRAVLDWGAETEYGISDGRIIPVTGQRKG
ncbi:IMPACT family protein [Candidatus Weimeria sp. HCP3S3_B5]|uniref:IMPACT family protein n=1 Tax=Candidatus Weimeria sp. HCP3S3_B5 TaxID=3438871 RepID=UPI003F8C251C